MLSKDAFKALIDVDSTAETVIYSFENNIFIREMIVNFIFSIETIKSYKSSTIK